SLADSRQRECGIERMQVVMLKVLLALDRAPSAKQTLDIAHDFLSEKGAAVTILRVIPQHMIYGRARGSVEVCAIPAERAVSTASLKNCAEYLQAGGGGTVIDGRTAFGDPAGLVQRATEKHVST